MGMSEREKQLLKIHYFSLDPHPNEILASLMRGGKFIQVPTDGGWTEIKTNSGSSAMGGFRLYVKTGVTANSTAIRHISTFALGDANHTQLNWGKKLYIICDIARSASDAQAVGRIQLKEATTEGVLAAKGIGLHVANLALHGESYGTARATVDLSTTLTAMQKYRVVIIHTPGIKIEWYIDGVLVGTQTTAANIPSGTAGATSTLMSSIINGAGGGVDAELDMFSPILWREN